MDPTSLLRGETLDDEFFLPSPGSNLANVFGDGLAKTAVDDNDSLKYTPTKPPDMNKLKEEPRPGSVEPTPAGSTNKTSECLIAKPVHAYELINGSYEARGKLGFAIMKMFSPPHIRLVVFTSSKATISSATASQNLEIIIQSNNYVTYYDDASKNWSLLFSNSHDLSEVIAELRKYSVKVNKPTENPTLSKNTAQSELGANNAEAESILKINTDKYEQKNYDKISIMNRMASVGQSVLPRPVMPLARRSTSDSSDENMHEKEKHFPLRHKTVKTLPLARKLEKVTIPESSDSSTYDCDKNTQVATIVSGASHSNINPTMPMCTYLHGQLVPIATNEVQNSSMNVFLSETRAANSEVRININRLSDKVDQVLDKLKLVDESKVTQNENLDKSPSFTLDVFQKLLHEYEDKIRLKDSQINLLQEKLVQTNQIDIPLRESHKDADIHLDGRNYDELHQKNEKIVSENEAYKIKMEELGSTLVLKDHEIEELKNHVRELEAKIETVHEIGDSKDRIKTENAQLVEKNISLKIKSLMNNTYKTLSVNFENETLYSGNEIINIIAAVIKQTTLDSLSPSENKEAKH